MSAWTTIHNVCVESSGMVSDSVLTDRIIEELTSAGYRILAPGELDSVTLKAAAKEADEIALAVNEAPATRCVEDAIQNASIQATAEDIARNIRNLRSAG